MSVSMIDERDATPGKPEFGIVSACYSDHKIGGIAEGNLDSLKQGDCVT
jgi:hypothetical protein